jgi:chlorite dismutase
MSIDTFVGGREGAWEITRIQAIAGAGLDMAPRLSVVNGVYIDAPSMASWRLRGAASHVRYSTRSEVTRLAQVQPRPGRDESTMVVLIPMGKSSDWWELAQDERQVILGKASRHAEIGMDYLPAVARKLYHCRDLGEPFDFLTWFEFAPGNEAAFDRLLARLRSTPEWRYVDREVEVRLTRHAPSIQQHMDGLGKDDLE